MRHSVAVTRLHVHVTSGNVREIGFKYAKMYILKTSAEQVTGQ